MMSTEVWSGGCCFKQKTSYDRRISDWSSDVCSSDLYRFDQFDVGGLVGVDARFGLGHGHDFRLEAETEPGARDALLNRKEAEQRADEQPWAEGGDDLEHLLDRKSTRLNSSHQCATRMPYSA